ncbi:hypothetical protein PN498_28350 [Oscillatoria sp. CS-180]|uniref:hypothetical protein n=1 Tax=Oscillatoria sp. CS-180 TaxID=3021720 RepID=UPI00233139B2|nr:hypothetical protein [Oscillatoria sp. CS-180]MDB9529931.1 hypothetical protein [Oscillatoria sp. CS-180]
MKNLDVFNYVVILVSIILALGIGGIIEGFAKSLKHIKNVSFYPLHSLISCLLFLLQIQYWIGTFEERDLNTWSFLYILVLLLSPVGYYLVSEIIFPEISGEEKVDLKKYYWKQNRMIYGIAAFIQMNNFIADLLINTKGNLIDNIIRLLAMLVLVSLCIVNKPVFHYFCSALLLALFITFVVFSSPSISV